MRSGLPVAAFVLAATLTARAEEALQDRFPYGMEVISAREIGSSLRMFSFATAQDGEALLAGWQAALREDGYQITQSRDDIIGPAVEFSGDGILNAKILGAPQSDSGLSVIEIDATLR